MEAFYKCGRNVTADNYFTTLNLAKKFEEKWFKFGGYNTHREKQIMRYNLKKDVGRLF